MNTDSPPLAPGLSGTVERTVTHELTAAALGSGLVPVFATPSLVALMEAAAVHALEGVLAEGQTSVGTRIDIRHLAATPVGMRARATATLTEVDGRRLVFTVEAWDDQELIGTGTHERMIVDWGRFVERVQRKAIS